MLKTFIAFLRLCAYLIRLSPSMRKANGLDRAGDTAARDAIVVPRVQEWGRFIVSLAKGRVEVRGQENIPKDTAVVFIGNHQSYFDIPILLGYVDKPKAFISKIEILKAPLLSDWMRLMQCTFLDRKDMRQSVRAMQEAVATVKRGYSLVIFPEGTRSKGGPVKEFKAGSFKLALKAEVPIVPVTIDGSWRLYEDKKSLREGDVRITIHPPVETKGLSREDAQTLPDRIRATVVSALQ
jgi:1-acyl-sn-glycerol-3-phosphate acyltransferase